MPGVEDVLTPDAWKSPTLSEVMLESDVKGFVGAEDFVVLDVGDIIGEKLGLESALPPKC